MESAGHAPTHFKEADVKAGTRIGWSYRRALRNKSFWFCFQYGRDLSIVLRREEVCLGWPPLPCRIIHSAASPLSFPRWITCYMVILSVELAAGERQKMQQREGGLLVGIRFWRQEWLLGRRRAESRKEGV